MGTRKKSCKSFRNISRSIRNVGLKSLDWNTLIEEGLESASIIRACLKGPMCVKVMMNLEKKLSHLKGPVKKTCFSYPIFFSLQEIKVITFLHLNLPC